MYFYTLSSSDHESYKVHYLMHKRSFRQNEWNKMVFDCAIEVSKTLWEEDKKTYDELNEYMKENPDIYSDFDPYTTDDIRMDLEKMIDPIADMMCDKYGFKYIPIKQYFHGWGLACMRESGYRYREYITDRLQRKIARKIKEMFPIIDRKRWR